MSTSPGRALTFEHIGDRAGLERLTSEWERLWARAIDATPFQHPAWLIPWWDCFAQGALHTLAVRDRDELVGLVPMYERSGRVRLLGEGVSDYLDLLVRPDLAGAVLDALADAAGSQPDWEQCCFNHLRVTSPLTRLRLSDRFEASDRDEEPCLAIRLPGSVDAFWEAAPAALRRNVRYYRRRAQSLGELAIDVTSACSLDAHLTELFRLHERRWRERGAAGVLSDAAVRDFHRRAAASLLAAGALRMLALRLDGRVIAVHYGMLAAGRALFYIGGFDPAFRALSPGTLALAAAVELAIQDGAGVFDLLAGRERYKHHWGATEEPRVGRCFRAHAGARVSTT